MKLPFTTAQFFEVIEKYNASMFPFQILILVLGIVCLFILHSGFSWKDRLIGSYLGFLWIWIGIAYHIVFFTIINKAALLFGGIFILQGLLIFLNTFKGDRLVFTFLFKTKDWLGYFLIMYGLVIYPVISYFVEGTFEKTIMMGLPCPSTIFTFGFFVLTTNRFPKYLLIIPSLWAVVGLSAAIIIGVFQDVMIFVAAIIVDFVLVKRKN